jgi:acyl carrier protein
MNALSESIKQKLVFSLENIGIYISEEEKESDFNLSDYILDSLLFVTFFVELEKNLGIEIPDIYLSIEKFVSVDAFCISISELLQ